MNNYLTPKIDSVGAYTAGAPFDQVVSANTVYRCQAVRLLVDMISSGEDPYGTIYAPLGLSEAEFNIDVEERVSIVTLVSGGTKYIDVPDKYLTSIPVLAGVTYQSKALSINLYSLPFDVIENALPSLMNDIASLIYSRLGITPEVTSLSTSPEFKVDYAVHDANTTARNNNITSRKSYETLYRESLDQINTYALYIQELEEYIKNN